MTPTQQLKDQEMNKVSIWLSKATIPEKEFDEYIDEYWGDERKAKYRGSAIAFYESEFAKSQFEADFSIWYDHDCFEASFRKKEVTIANLLSKLSYQETFVENVVATAKKKRIAKSNAVVAIYGSAFQLEPGDISRKAKLKLIGSFDFERPVDPAKTAYDVKKKNKFCLKRTRTDEFDEPISFETWAIERKKNTLVVYSGKHISRMKESHKEYRDTATARDKMESWIQKKIDSGFTIEPWPRKGFNR